jgi:SAM-dependent methyltransferase
MTSIDFATRSTAGELMDAEGVSFEELRGCLVDLARVNRITLTHRPTLAFLDRLAAHGLPQGRPLEVVDVGSGYGDALRAIDAWATERGVAVSLTGVDLNPWSRRAAELATPAGRPIQWVTADAFAYAPPAGIDVILSSQFTHHLPDALVVRFLRWMEATARVGWFVNDLHRHPLPYHFFRHFARLARFHRIVQYDGLVSITRAFTRADWRALVAEAGVDASAVEVRWRVPFRITVERLRDPAGREGAR